MVVKKSLWYFQLLDTNEIIYLTVMNTFGFGSEQAIIKYEHPGSNGGSIKNNGRLNEQAILNCNIIGENLKDVENKIKKLKNIKENGKSLRLVGPFQYSSTGRHLISGISGSIDAGSIMNSVITITLEEDREFTTKISAVSLVAFQPFEEFQKVLIARTGQGGGT